MKKQRIIYRTYNNISQREFKLQEELNIERKTMRDQEHKKYVDLLREAEMKNEMEKRD